MRSRPATVIGVLALSTIALSVTNLPAAAHAAPGRPTAAGGVAAARTAEDPGHALSRLRAAARGTVKAQRDATGRVDHLSSASGRALLPAPSGADTPRAAVASQLQEYGAAFGVDGTRSKAVVSQTIASSTGGSIVRADQVVDGLPVFGGQVVTTLDRQDGVVSVNAATTAATDVPAATISRARARATALALVSRAHGIARGKLTVVDKGEYLYDPALVHTVDPAGVRPVWQLEVGNGSNVRETVLIGARRGEVALHFNQVAHLNRSICDNANAHTVRSDAQVPICSTPARTETGPSSSVGDVNAAYTNLGQTAQAYSDLDGLDLTALIGQGSGAGKALTSTVRWCYSDLPCPFDNAFWDGRQMVFGQGYAGANDVVGHELTHGYVEKTSNLFYFHQSGSLNESLADTIGEIVDHRNGADDDSGWTIGEDLGDPTLTRSMKDPTASGEPQPDKMTSSLYANSRIDDQDSADNGDVHVNDGVGNKTAYLISQGTAALPGGSFNGHTVTGIDGSDPGLAKTGRLYLETIPALTSGSQYADLGTTLVATCQRLAAAGTGGFTAGDCTSVSDAVAATELSTAPAGGAQQAPVSCVSNTSVKQLARDDDGIAQLGLTTSSNLWGRTDGGVTVPDYASSGKTSLFAFDPDPSLGDDPVNDLYTKAFTLPLTTGGTFLNFHHAFVFDAETDQGNTYRYYDGARVFVQKLVGKTWTTVSLPSSAWVNGPNRTIVGSTATPFTGFGGDSQGYMSSQLALTSLAGQTVRFVFRVEGDSDVSQYGWWVDDVRLYSCAQAAPSAVRSLSTRVSGSSVVVSWAAPAAPGAGVASYRVRRSDGATRILPASSRSVVLTGFTGTSSVSIAVDAGAPDKTYGPVASKAVYATTPSLSSSAAKVKKNKAFTLTARVVRRGASVPAAGVPVVLQRKVGSSWANVSGGTTSSRGTKAWVLKMKKTASYRVVVRGSGTWFGSVSGARTVKKK